MTCPFFVDYTRECMAKIEVYPEELTPDMLDFCMGEKYTLCPFYQILADGENVCKNITHCPAFKNFQSEDYNKFAEMANEYCTTKNHRKCKRYLMKEQGEEVPIWLHPDGSRVKKWETKKD